MKLTQNGFTEEFEKEVLQAVAESDSISFKNAEEALDYLRSISKKDA